MSSDWYTSNKIHFFLLQSSKNVTKPNEFERRMHFKGVVAKRTLAYTQTIKIKDMIQCKIPLKLNKYICYELPKTYQERKCKLCP